MPFLLKFPSKKKEGNFESGRNFKDTFNESIQLVWGLTRVLKESMYIVLIEFFILFKLTQEIIQLYIVCQYINDTLYIALYMKIS